MVKLEDIREIIYSTWNDYYGLNNKCSIIKSTYFYNEAVRLSEKYGLRLKRCTRTQLRFEDKHENPNKLNKDITSTELRFDNMLRNSWINMIDDTENIDDGLYSLDTVLGYYTSMPDLLKTGTGLITFDDTTQNNYSIIYDPTLRRENVVHITLDSFGLNHSSVHNLERIMAHEMGHCLEMGKLTPREKNIMKQIFVDKRIDLDESEIRLFNNVLAKSNTYSGNDGVFGKAVDGEYHQGHIDYEIINKDELIKSTYALKYYNETGSLSEHFAETVSILSFRDKPDKTNATLYSGYMNTPITYYEYVLEGGQTQSIPVVEELLFGDSKGYDIGYVSYE